MGRSILDKIISKFNAISLYKSPLLYLSDFLGKKNGQEFVYELNNGLKFSVRGGTCDRGIIDEIFAYKIYSPAGFEIKEGDIVFDVGAQIGVFSVCAASQKAGRVYSFEPMPENFSLLEKNICINNLHNIEAVPAALAKDEGQKDFFLSENTGGHSLCGSDKQKKITVESRNLAAFIAEKKIEKIDYFKIDCEGGEYEIFFSAPDEVFAKIKKIAMEYHNLDEARNVEKIKTFLESKGFKVDVVTGLFPMLYATK
jgi:FkbM family methyltransferase